MVRSEAAILQIRCSESMRGRQTNIVRSRPECVYPSHLFTKTSATFPSARVCSWALVRGMVADWNASAYESGNWGRRHNWILGRRRRGSKLLNCRDRRVNQQWGPRCWSLLRCLEDQLPKNIGIVALKSLLRTVLS